MTMHIRTPLLESLVLSQQCGAQVWMKMEALQPSGSFKMRGIGHACMHHHARGTKRFISSSGGNAGLAVAYAGRQLDVPVMVVVPETTPQRAKHLLLMEGAHVIVHGRSWFEAHQHALSLETPEDAFLHPFDDPMLWEGHASMIDEVVADGVIPDAVILSVGGGGLLSGVDEGLSRNGLGTTPIYAAETEGTASFNAALQAGHPIEIPSVTGVATSLGAKQVCHRAYELTQQRPVYSFKVTDQEAIHACTQFLDDHRMLVEPACGAALALLYDKKMSLPAHNKILVIVCGGSTITSEFLTQHQ